MGPKVPGTLLHDESTYELEAQEEATTPGSRMFMNVVRREAAHFAFIRMDNDNRYRTALLRKSKPSKGVFPLGAYVYFRREQARQTGPAQTQSIDGLVQLV